jgi:small-conductance mechanosensitive channel
MWRAYALLLLAAWLPQPALAAEGAAEEFETATVMVDGRPLAEVRGVAGQPAAERSAAIAGRIVEAARDPSVAIDDLHVVETPIASQIQAGPRLLMGVLDADAAVEQVDRRTLAEVQLRLVREAIARYRAEREPARMRAAAINAVVATAVFLAALVIAIFAWRRIAAAAEARLRPRILALRFETLQFSPGQHVWASLAATGRGLRFLLVAVLVFLYVEYLLAQFPATRPTSLRLAGYLLDPLARMGRGVMEELPSLMFLLVLFIVVRFILRLLRLYFAALGSSAVHVAGFEPQWAEPTYRLVRIAVIAFALVVAYPYIPGSESEAFKGLSIFAGVLISIGSSSFIANYMAGYTLIYRRLFKVGDRVQIGDIVGEVLEVRVQVTRLRTYKNEEVILPNSTILTSVVTNYTTLAAGRGLILHTTVGIGYEVPWRKIEGMLLMAAERTKSVLKDPPPFVLQKGLGDFAVSYEINAYVSSAADLAQRYDELHGHIQDVFNEYGVQIMTPAYEGDPETPKTVPREQWYAEPSRRPVT